MKVAPLVASLVGLGVLVALSADVDQHAWQENMSLSGENDGRSATVAVAAPALTETASPSSKIARPHDRIARTSPRLDANGSSAIVTVRTAYGFNIRVHAAYAGKFQRFFALLKEHGYKVPANITKCWAPQGTHVPGSNHYIGAACDIQTGWNRGPAFVYHMSDIVKQAGLYDGCSFRDCGHVEAVRGTHNRAPNLYAALEKFKSEQATENFQP